MQAIETRYLGPTNARGSRIRAKAAAGSLTVSYDHALNSAANHKAAAVALANKFGWLTGKPGEPMGRNENEVFSGKLASGDGVHVLVPTDPETLADAKRDCWV